MISMKKKVYAAILVLYTVFFYLWIFLFNGSQADRAAISDILQMIPPIIALILLIKTFLKAPKQKRSFWLLMSIGCGSYLVSQLLWGYYEIVFHIYNPIITYSAITWCLSTTCYIAALSVKIIEKREKKLTKLFAVDTLTVMCIAVAVTWIYTIQPGYYSMADQSFLVKLHALAYILGNLICFFGAVYLYFTLRPTDAEKRSLHMISLAFLIKFIVNSAYAHMTVIGTFRSGSMIDPLWSLYVLLLGYSALLYPILQSEEEGIQRQMPAYASNSKLFAAFPFVSVILLFILMLFVDSQVTWLFSALAICLITLRHILTIAENKQLIESLGQLNNNLEDKVSERTQELFSIAFYDQITGLPNRKMFKMNLKKAVSLAKQSSSPLALMFLDLDRFKIINDNYGHSFGDLMLKEIAERIKGCVETNSCISRQGGDEFALIVENYDSVMDLNTLAEKILAEIAKPINLLDQNVYTSCSIGIATYSDSSPDPGTLMRYADAAMYYSKEKGKNTYQIYTEELDKSISKKLELETALTKALENRELYLYYQPQINIISGEITGAEALLRWKHPSLGMVSPQDFIPIAEETGMIKEIGLWVLKTACMQAKQWHDDGFAGLKVGVNISPKQIQMDNFVALVAKVLQETGLSPEFLDLEITEGVSFQNEEEVIIKLNELKKIGVEISIDDFGTGYSSLSYLNKLPVDTLKIAQQFVRQIKADSSNKAIVSSIIAVAESLKLKVIAEGVEESYQYDFLKAQNCYDMQGFIFSKAIPIEDFYALLLKRKSSTTEAAN